MRSGPGIGEAARQIPLNVVFIFGPSKQGADFLKVGCHSFRVKLWKLIFFRAPGRFCERDTWKNLCAVFGDRTYQPADLSEILPNQIANPLLAAPNLSKNSEHHFVVNPTLFRYSPPSRIVEKAFDQLIECQTSRLHAHARLVQVNAMEDRPMIAEKPTARRSGPPTDTAPSRVMASATRLAWPISPATSRSLWRSAKTPCRSG